jgi:serine/threonine protein kinase
MKVPHANLGDMAEVHERFKREAQIGARLKHPNLCPVYACEVYDDIPHLVMEFVEGATLSNFRKTPWLVPQLKDAVQIVKCLAHALAAFHSCSGSPLHLDLKPSNVQVTLPPERRPVLIDFGLALRLSCCADYRPGPGQIIGTLEYMAPEQINPGTEPLGHATDVYALGAMLYELLTGRPPFQVQGVTDAMIKVLNEPPIAPSKLNKKITPALDQICLKALAKDMRDRFQTMTEFAERLEKVVVEGRPGGNDRPLLRRDVIRFAFAGYGEVAPPALQHRNRLFLDVGNGLRPGVIDHHHVVGSGSVSRLIPDYLDLIDRAVTSGGADDFTIILHQSPDLDCVVSAFLAIEYLTTRKLPDGIRKLTDYVDRVDAGLPMMSTAFPFTLYAAQEQLLGRSTGRNNIERWNLVVRDGLQLVEYVLQRMRDHHEEIDAIDAFACPNLFGPEDRAAVTDDEKKRYPAKLTDPRTAARVAQVCVPGQFGGPVNLDALLVRDVQNPDDPARVRYFKFWARSDTRRSAQGRGFEALSVFSLEDAKRPRRCILSVTPESDASLRGLGALLEAAETAERERINGEDDRKIDPVTNEPRVPRPGSDNADPWYDGKSHGYTIVDSPRGGTVLDADTIERIFLEFGAAQASPLQPL